MPAFQAASATWTRRLPASSKERAASLQCPLSSDVHPSKNYKAMIGRNCITHCRFSPRGGVTINLLRPFSSDKKTIIRVVGFLRFPLFPDKAKHQWCRSSSFPADLASGSVGPLLLFGATDFDHKCVTCLVDVIFGRRKIDVSQFLSVK